jgi:hypothetical protein
MMSIPFVNRLLTFVPPVALKLVFALNLEDLIPALLFGEWIESETDAVISTTLQGFHPCPSLFFSLLDLYNPVSMAVR